VGVADVHTRAAPVHCTWAYARARAVCWLEVAQMVPDWVLGSGAGSLLWLTAAVRCCFKLHV
jgi:hypothetical protein